MIIAVCVDDNGGTMFNHRRQSKDRVLCEELLKLVANNILRMSPYSAKQFPAETQSRLAVDDRFLDLAQPGDYCFEEGVALSPYEESIEEMILFKWNRAYPKDTSLDIDIDGPEWELIDSFDFEGFSHEKITRERYKRKG